jgi:AcrR family transcriptional regulator
MGKVELNKQNKRSSLLQHAYELFVDRGFNKTTIADIAKHSGLAKGTFYLYFKDKYDLRDELVARKSGQLILEAQEALKVRPEPLHDFEEYLLALIDYILNYLQRNKMLLKFIAKNLSWGIFKHAVETPSSIESDNLSDIYKNYLHALEQTPYHYANPELLLFTIIELASSTGYSTILYESPCSLEAYLPHLHQSIHQILEGYRRPEMAED